MYTEAKENQRSLEKAFHIGNMKNTLFPQEVSLSQDAFWGLVTIQL